MNRLFRPEERPLDAIAAAFVVALAFVLALPSSAAALPPACAEDPALAEAALALLLDGATAPSADALEAALRAASAEAPSARARSFAVGDQEGLTAWITALAAQADAPVFCGEAEDGERILVLAAEIGGRIEAVGEAPTRLRVRVHPSLGRPHLVVEDAEGRLVRLPVEVRNGGAEVAVADELALPITVQLVAEGRHGPRPFAERVVFAARGTGERASDIGPSTDGDADVPARVAGLRAHHGASSLRPNRLLDAEATAHAVHVCREGRVAHRLDDGDPEERLARRGLSARVVGETVARAATVRRALAALAESPSHRLTLVDRRFTDAGYGVATDARGARCVVVLLAAWPRALGR